MRIMLGTQDLNTIVKNFPKILPRQKSLPVLQHLKFAPDVGTDATVTATNLEETLILTLRNVSQEPTEPEPFMCPFTVLKKLAREIKKGDTVTLHSGTGTEASTLKMAVSLKGQVIHSEVASISVQEFPETVQMIHGKGCPVGQFLETYQKAIVFASTDETRFLLTGVFFHAEEHSLVATDGKRLIVSPLSDIPLESDFTLPPSKILKNGVLAESTGYIGLLDQDNIQVLGITAGPWHYQVKCLEGVYPNYRQVIPDENGQSLGRIVFAEEDISLIRTGVSQFAGKQDADVRIYADHDKVILLGAESADSEPYPYFLLPHSTCECAKPMVHSINGKFLLDGLNAGFTTARIPSDHSPWRCTGDVAGLHVVMPLRFVPREEEAILDYVIKHINPSGKEKFMEQAIEKKTIPEESTANTSEQEHRPDLKIIESDPLQELLDTVATAQDAIRQANTAVRELKAKAKNVERLIKSRERDYETTRKVISSLKAVGF